MITRDMFVSFPDNPLTCCSAQQIFTIDLNMNMAEGVFGRCSTCLRNMFRHICDYSCSANQSKFMNVTKSKVNENGLYYVEELEVTTLNMNEIKYLELFFIAWFFSLTNIRKMKEKRSIVNLD